MSTMYSTKKPTVRSYWQTQPEDGLRSSLIQEVVRRLQNTGVDIQLSERTDILYKFGQKMINSRH